MIEVKLVYIMSAIDGYYAPRRSNDQKGFHQNLAPDFDIMSIERDPVGLVSYGPDGSIRVLGGW